MHAGLVILRIAALENRSGPRTAGRWRGPRERHVLIQNVFLLVAVLGIAEGVAIAMGRVRDAALCQSLQVIVKGIRWQRRGLARIVTIVLEGLTGRRGKGTWYVEIRGIVLLWRKHLRYTQCLSLPDAGVYLAELAAKHMLDVGDTLRRAYKCTFRYKVYIHKCN